MLNNNLLLFIGRNATWIIFYILLFLSAITKKQSIIFLFLLVITSDIINSLLKIIAERIMGNKKFTIIGKGTRPVKKLKSYGMPSGHSQYIATFSTFLILLTYNNRNLHKYEKLMCYLLLSLITFYVMYERVYEKFHTIQQTIIGMFIGMLFGKIGFNIYTSF